MAGRLKRETPVKNAIASLTATFFVAFIFWLLFAVARWDFSPNPATFPMGERIVLVIVLIVVYFCAREIDPEDTI